MGMDESGIVAAKKANSRGLHPGGRPPRRGGYAEQTERNQDMATDYIVHRLPLAEIAAKHGVTMARVSQIIGRLRESGKIDFNEMRNKSRLVLEEIQRRQLEISNLMPAPVTVGKDGTILVDPETAEVVRDYAGQLAALAAAVRTDDSIAKRFGLDAATKTEVAAVVKYEVVGLATDDLT